LIFLMPFHGRPKRPPIDLAPIFLMILFREARLRAPSGTV
jgi:hypothetical protein